MAVLIFPVICLHVFLSQSYSHQNKKKVILVHLLFFCFYESWRKFMEGNLQTERSMLDPRAIVCIHASSHEILSSICVFASTQSQVFFPVCIYIHPLRFIFLPLPSKRHPFMYVAASTHWDTPLCGCICLLTLRCLTPSLYVFCPLSCILPCVYLPPPTKMYHSRQGIGGAHL